jgi:hypothetical protein
MLGGVFLCPARSLTVVLMLACVENSHASISPWWRGCETNFTQVWDPELGLLEQNQEIHAASSDAFNSSSDTTDTTEQNPETTADSSSTSSDAFNSSLDTMDTAEQNPETTADSSLISSDAFNSASDTTEQNPETTADSSLASSPDDARALLAVRDSQLEGRVSKKNKKWGRLGKFAHFVTTPVRVPAKAVARGVGNGYNAVRKSQTVTNASEVLNHGLSKCPVLNQNAFMAKYSSYSKEDGTVPGKLNAIYITIVKGEIPETKHTSGWRAGFTTNPYVKFWVGKEGSYNRVLGNTFSRNSALGSHLDYEASWLGKTTSSPFDATADITLQTWNFGCLFFYPSKEVAKDDDLNINAVVMDWNTGFDTRIAKIDPASPLWPKTIVELKNKTDEEGSYTADFPLVVANSNHYKKGTRRGPMFLTVKFHLIDDLAGAYPQ